MRQVNYASSKFFKLNFGITPSTISFPVIPNKNGLKWDCFSNLNLVEGIDDHAFIDFLDRTENFRPILSRNNWGFIFIRLNKLICINPYYQIVTMGLSIFNKIKVTDMKHIKRPLCISDNEIRLRLNLSTMPVPLIQRRKGHVITIDLRQISIEIRRSIELQTIKFVK